MANFEPDDDGIDETDDELEITDLRPRPVDSEGGIGHRHRSLSSRLDSRIGHRLALALVIGLVLAAVMSALPQVGDLLGISKSVADSSL